MVAQLRSPGETVLGCGQSFPPSEKLGLAGNRLPDSRAWIHERPQRLFSSAFLFEAKKRVTRWSLFCTIGLV